MTLNRREFVQLAGAIGASLAWGGSARASTTAWHERRDLYPEGVASGDPDPTSVILWTRRPFESGGRRVLTVEVAEDDAFRRVVAKASAPVSAESDWTARVLVGHLKPARVYWYRFADGEGNGSRVGRTITAPPANDPRPVNFAFVSCQSVNEGKLNAYRRMIFEDERAAPAPAKFEPVGISFVGASLASPGPMEAFEHNLPKDHPLRSLFLADRPAGKPEWTYNMLLKHGVRSCLEYARSFDLKRAHAVSNPKLSPHLEFVDMGGHGYATVRLTADEMRTEFVCIPRPITRSDRPDGGPLRYRVVHTASLWKAGQRPLLRQQVIEGDPGLSI